MEVEHLVGIGVALIVSLILMWIVWSYFCQEKGEDIEQDMKSDPEESENFSSTYVITKAQIKQANRNRREISLSSCNDVTTEDECEGGGSRDNNRSKSQRTKRKSKKHRDSSYRYQKNNYGLADPFAAWEQTKIRPDDTSPPPQVVYPKSPVLKHHCFKDQSVIDI